MSEQKPYSFYKILPDGRLEFHVDASLMKDFMICERSFYYKHIKNFRPKGHRLVKPFPMAIGSWWSDVMEAFYDHMRSNTELTLDMVQQIGLEMWAKENLDLCAQEYPKQFEKFGDLAGAILMLTEYYNSQYLIDKNNWKIISVEQGFGLRNEVLVGETGRVKVYWIGKPDLSVSESGRLEPVDHKTVTKIDGDTATRFKPSYQMVGYVHSLEVIAKSLGLDLRVDRCVVNICARERPTDNPRNGKKRPRFIRAYPTFNRDEIAEWKKDLMTRCEWLATCLRTNQWPMRETSCHNVYRRNCEYLSICSVVPMARDTVIQANFEQAQPWVPYQVAKTESEE